MRLTNDMRSGIVHRILGDIPTVDHEATMRARAAAIAVERLPADVRRIWNGPSKEWVKTRSVHICCMTFMIPAMGDYADDKILKTAIEADAAFSDAHRAHDEQRDARRKIRHELDASLTGCFTRKQFIDRFPELAKYAPTIFNVTVANLPATTGLVDHLIAAGLPVVADEAAHS